MLQVDNAIMVLASPYPKHGLVEVINQTAQIVTGEGNPVPLSEVCASIWIAENIAGHLSSQASSCDEERQLFITSCCLCEPLL